LIDLHLHTTASDGRSSPTELVAEAVAAGLKTIAVTDHDTLQAVLETQRAANRAGLTCVTGIEMTAVHRGRDVHVLGYFLRLDDPELGSFLEVQRELRRRRVAEMIARLAGLGLAIDREAIDAAATQSGRSIGRPAVARALVSSGLVRDVNEAFERYIGENGPAFVPREGAPPEDVIARIAKAGGLASIAHPGKTGRDEEIARWTTSGLSAIEVFHPDHSAEDRARYGDMALALGLLVTGGSDYHGPGSGRAVALGQSVLPSADFERLRARAGA
jgi:predicted metal-dependent phosphoesterase TrpH